MIMYAVDYRLMCGPLNTIPKVTTFEAQSVTLNTGGYTDLLGQSDVTKGTQLNGINIC